MLSHTKENFQTYPINRVVAIVDTKSEADKVVSDLIRAGFDESQIDASVGVDGLKFLDPEGRSHGMMTKLVRVWQKFAQGEEANYLKRMKNGLSAGRAVVSVPALTEEARCEVTRILQAHHAEFIRFYGRFYVEHLDKMNG